MAEQRHLVDYALQRRAVLAGVRSGRVDIAEVCDASSYLRKAAEFHGESRNADCPLCDKHALMQVSWVYGEELKHISGSARQPDELVRMATLFAEFTVYVVEVCLRCGWNHLVQSYVLGNESHRYPKATGKTTRKTTTRKTAGS